MTDHTGTGPIQVLLIESERGQRLVIDEIRRFQTMKGAKEFIKRYNAKNTEAVAPDWYMYARLAPEPKP